ncbi:hypothetical protein KR009_000922 [Drosophila setifemur]|nr:hypothetical protein KR009_000922 [Drosophila setifemur]
MLSASATVAVRSRNRVISLEGICLDSTPCSGPVLNRRRHAPRCPSPGPNLGLRLIRIGLIVMVQMEACLVAGVPCTHTRLHATMTAMHHPCRSVDFRPTVGAAPQSSYRLQGQLRLIVLVIVLRRNGEIDLAPPSRSGCHKAHGNHEQEQKVLKRTHVENKLRAPIWR